jgi:hypothetical protein
MSTGNYTRTPSNRNLLRESGPFEAIVVNHLDRKYMGGLEVEILRNSAAGSTPERTGQLANVRYLMPFYGVTPNKGLTNNDGYQFTQKSYGMWMVPPDIGTKVLCIFAEGDLNNGYWIGCIPEDYMNFMVPGGTPSTERTTENTPQNLKGAKLPVGEYNKRVETGQLVDPTLFNKPYNKDFTNVLETQGLIFDETRGTTTSSARREVPSAVFGINTPGTRDRRQDSPKFEIGTEPEKARLPYNRLGGHSFVMDDGDDKFIRKTHAEDGPPEYVNKEIGDPGGDETIPQNELLRFRTRTGHQILLHNSEDLIYIGNSRGTAWIEITSDGKIDIHADDSISIMTDTDLNITAERDINFEAGRNINMKATARWSKGAEKDGRGLESGRIQFEAQHNYNLQVGKDAKITVGRDQHNGVGRDSYHSNGRFYQLNSGQDNRFSSQGSTHIKSAREHRETATYIHMNGPGAASAQQAQTVTPLSTVTLPYTIPGSFTPVSYQSILTRAPQHEPWQHHENMNPLAYKKPETDREAPGGLATADRIITPDTFAKNKGNRNCSAYVAGSGGNISSGNYDSRAGGTGSGTGTAPSGNYSSSVDLPEDGNYRLGTLSAQYESGRDGPVAIGWDSTGGWSYGQYQLAANTGAVGEYLSWCQSNAPDVYEALSRAGGDSAARQGTDTFKNTWTTLMADAHAAETQHSYIANKYYGGGLRSIQRRTGVDLSSRSPIVGDVIWSTSVQHGAGGCARIFERAFQTLGTTNPSDAAIIEAVYNERGRDNGQAYFGRSTANVRAGVVRRFRNEKADALRYLAQYTEAQDRPVIAQGETVDGNTPTVG